MKKTALSLFAMTLALAMLLSLVTSCGKTPDNNSTPVSDDSISVTDSDTDVSGEDSEYVDVPEDSGDTGDISTSVNENPDTPNNTTASKKKTTAAKKKTTSTTRKIDSSVGKVDLKGYEFVIATVNIPVAGNSAYDDAVLARNAQVEKELNCSIVYNYFSDVTYFDDMTPTIMAGDKPADAIIEPMHAFGRFLNAQYLYNLNELKDIDQSSIAYDKIGFINTTLASGTYGLTGTIARSRLGTGIQYNKTLLDKMKLEDPADLVAQGKWTWDAFKSLVQKATRDLDNDGMWTTKDQWGCSSTGNGGIMSFFVASGNQSLTMENKKIAYTMDTAKSLEALTELKNIFTIPGALYEASDLMAKEHFFYDEGKCLFWIGQALRPVEWITTDNVIGLVPMPMGNNTKDYISAGDWNNCILMVPKTIKNPKATGTIIQRLSEVAYQNGEDNLMIDFFTSGYEDRYKEIYQKYIYPKFYFDASNLYRAMSLNVYNATECVVCNPILLDQTGYVASEMIDSYKDTCTKFLKVIQNK